MFRKKTIVRFMKRLKQRIHDLTEDFSWEYHLQKFIAALYAGQNRRKKRIAPSFLPQRRQNRRDIVHVCCADRNSHRVRLS